MDFETHYDDVDLEQADSRAIITTRATRHEIIEDDGRYDDTTEFKTEGYIEWDRYLETSLINLDAYFDPDYLTDWSTEINKGPEGVYYTTGYSDVEIRFDLFERELRAAAERRAGEDRTHPVRVLASWLWQIGGGKKHIDASQAGIFHKALKKEVLGRDDVPEWGLCYGGDPDRWRHDDDNLVTDLDEARTYARGGYEDVREARGESQ